MDVEITTAAEDEPDELELRSLHHWLLAETPRPGHIAIVAARSQPGAMGAATEALQVALGAGGAATVLAGSLSTWINTRRCRVRVILKRADGEQLQIDAETNDAEAI